MKALKSPRAAEDEEKF